MTLNVFTVTKILQFGPRDVFVVTEQQNEILIIRTTSSSPKELVTRTTSLPFKDSLSASQKKKKKENPFILSTSTVSVLLQTNARSKRARGPTLDYKVMYEGK